MKTAQLQGCSNTHVVAVPMITKQLHKYKRPVDFWQ